MDSLSLGNFYYMLQAPEKFAAAAARNPVCNLALMVGTSDIPDWCFVESYGVEGNAKYTDAPTMEHLTVLYNKSPIAHINKVIYLETSRHVI